MNRPRYYAQGVVTSLTEVACVDPQKNTPAISFKHATFREDGPVVLWIDRAATQTHATRYERPAHREIMRPAGLPEDALDFDADPADSVRARRAVNEWDSSETAWRPNVTISREYWKGLAVAERWLEYAADRVKVYDALVLLAVEYDFADEREVIETLAWMGINIGNSRHVRSPRGHGHRSPVRHGTVGGYTNRGCRCDLCREAARADRIRKSGRDPQTVQRHNSKYGVKAS